MSEKLPRSLSGEERKFILANCRSNSMRCNPVALSDAAVEQLLEELL